MQGRRNIFITGLTKLKILVKIVIAFMQAINVCVQYISSHLQCLLIYLTGTVLDKLSTFESEKIGLVKAGATGAVLLGLICTNHITGT